MNFELVITIIMSFKQIIPISLNEINNCASQFQDISRIFTLANLSRFDIDLTFSKDFKLERKLKLRSPFHEFNFAIFFLSKYFREDSIS